MENFIMTNPTELHFGKDVVQNMGRIAGQYGRHALLVYGQGSIKSNGIYALIMAQLQAAGISVTEYGGIRSNPVVEDVDLASELARKNQVDFILAVGGGSVIDSAKVMSIAIPAGIPAWDFFAGKAKPMTAIPLICVLTLAATGTEMNRFAVLQNHETQQKLGYRSDLIYPRHSFLDPSYTFSVPANYTAYGIADLIAHALEAWFGEGEAPLSDKFVAAIIREAIEAGPVLLHDLHNFTLRARIMYAATSALNGLTLYGKTSGEWGVHSIGHILSLLYDIPHGASLSIVYPAWLKLQQHRLSERIGLLSQEVFGIQDIGKGIQELETFFSQIGCPVRLSEFPDIQFDRNEIIHLMKESKAATYYHKLSHADYERITDMIM